MQSAFVTGATGFIGRHLVAGLLDRGVAVRALVRSPAKAGHLLREGVEIVAGSLADVDGWRTKLSGCDAVFHAAGLVAARRHRELHDVNAAAVGRLADACADVDTPPALVHLSSLAAGGPAPREAVRDEADPPRPVSAYGASKLAGEQLLARRAGRLPITVVRPGIVFGPHETSVAAMFQAVQWTRLHLTMGFRSPPLSLVSVADLIPLVVAAADQGKRLPADGAAAPGTGIYHAVDDREFPTHGEFGRRIARAIGVTTLVMPLPVPIAWPVAAAIEAFWNLRGQPSIVSPDKLREATVPSWAASAARARRDLGFSPRVSLDERLAETAAWLRGHGGL